MKRVLLLAATVALAAGLTSCRNYMFAPSDLQQDSLKSQKALADTVSMESLRLLPHATLR